MKRWTLIAVGMLLLGLSACSLMLPTPGMEPPPPTTAPVIPEPMRPMYNQAIAERTTAENAVAATVTALTTRPADPGLKATLDAQQAALDARKATVANMETFAPLLNAALAGLNKPSSNALVDFFNELAKVTPAPFSLIPGGIGAVLATIGLLGKKKAQAETEEEKKKKEEAEKAKAAEEAAHAATAKAILDAIDLYKTSGGKLGIKVESGTAKAIDPTLPYGKTGNAVSDGLAKAAGDELVAEPK